MGLKFNPYNPWEPKGDNNNMTDATGMPTSVPVTANGYYELPKFNNTIPLPKWNSLNKEVAEIAVKELNESTPEDWDKWNVLAPIDRWDNGLGGLDEKEKELWKQQNAGKIAGKDEAWVDRLWRNQEYVKLFGFDDDFYTLSKEERDKKYYDIITREAVAKKYGSNTNLDQLMNLTPEGKKELLQSEYKNDSQLQKEDNKEEDKGWWDYSLKDRWNSIASNSVRMGQENMFTGGVVAGVWNGGIGTLPGMALGGLAGMTAGVFTGILHPEDSKRISNNQRRIDNEEILNKITVADNDRKKEASKEDIADVQSKYMQAYYNGQISSNDVDEMFDKIALSGKRTSEPDELGNTEQYNYQGSSYYTTFKDTDEFEHFSTTDKLRYIAQTQVLAQKYGQGSALSILDQDMQKYVSDNQTGWTWAGNSLKNVWVGGIANIANNVVALQALAAGAIGGEEELNKYLKGEKDNWFWFDPSYWNKVDQYNDLGWQWADDTFGWKNNFAIAEENGGLSPSNNVVTPGTENDFWSWNTMNEAIRMNKFAWSDLLKNLALGKIVKGATRLAGGVEIAPGVLATESPLRARAINKLGSIGVMNASSLGIDAAYGMQTYEEVLRQNNKKLDKIIEQDTDAEVQRRLQTPKAQQEFRDLVAAENQRRQKRVAGRENARWIPVNEEEAFVAYTNKLRKQIREEQEVLHAEDRQQAQNDAASAYAVDASIEHLRMATTNGLFKSYLFDKGTLNALRSNNPYVATTVNKEGMYALAKHAERNKALGILGMNVWGGFQSNYFDDITVGFAEGFGIQDYNNYLLQKYNPAAYGSVIDDYVSPFVAGMAGAADATTAKRSFIDGGVGAIGSLFTFSPNIAGMVSHKQRMKEAAEANKRNGQEKKGISTAEWMSDYINNPLLQAVADAKSASRMTEAEINRRNDILKEHGYSFTNMVETLSALNQKTIHRQGTSYMEAKDAKDREAFTLATSLLSMKNSTIVQDAQVEPDKATWSRKKKAASIIGKGLNLMLGLPMFTEAESSYNHAMQSLQDAATIGESDNEAIRARQQELVETFIGLDQNKNALAGMSEQEKVDFAEERLKENATEILDMMDRIEQLQKKFDRSIEANLHPDMQQQLIYQYALNDRWKDRLSILDDEITGEEDFERTENPQEALIAKYGSMQGLERTRKAQEKRVTDAQNAYDKAVLEAKKENDPSKSVVENARIKAVRQWKKKSAADSLKKEQESLSRIKSEEVELRTILESGAAVISAENILRLNPNDRLRMLDDFYRSDYSEAQKVEIDKAKTLLIENDNNVSLDDAMEKVRDAAILSNRIEDNMEVAKRIMQNPYEANLMQQALKENRRRAVIDYFNDKIVAEAFNAFQADPESTLSVEKVAEKADGYSTAILNGMLKEIEKQLSRTRSAEEADDKTLSNMEDGIKAVLSQRDERLKETAKLDSFIRKTKKVNHTEVKLQNDAPVIDIETGLPTTSTDGQVMTKYAEQVTTERELSENDKKLLDAALDYAAERNIPIDQLSEAIISEGFNNYLQERNHAYELTVNPLTGGVYETNVGTVENRANPVRSIYMSELIDDVVKAYNVNKETVQNAKEDKPVATMPESVATAPVETKGTIATREEEVRPDEVDPNDPFGFKKDKKDTAARPAPTTPEEQVGRNAKILEDASVLNNTILDDVSALLDAVDKMQMPEQTREKLKDIIEANLNGKAFNNIQELQNRIMEDAIVTNQSEAPQIDAKATALASMNIGSEKERKITPPVKADQEGEESNNNLLPLPPAPAILETRDLDILMNYPIWKSYIEQHGVIPFLQKLSDAWNKEAEAWRQTGKQGFLHQSQVVFIYDPALAQAVRNDIENNGGFYNPEISSPILMALEITDKNKHLVSDESQLISIKDKTDNKEHKYQMVGAMPASEVSVNDSEIMRTTAARMTGLRSRINFEDTNAHVLRYAPQNDTGKYNGTPIRTNIAKVSSHTEEDTIPHATKDTPKTGVQQLMDENLNSATESFVNVTEEEQQVYNEAKQKGLPEVRKTNLYKKLRKAFIDRLFKREREAQNPDDPNTKELNFNLQKGTNDTYPKIVLIKKIGETLDKNTGRPVVDLLREVDDAGSNAQEVIDSNSRFKRLFNQLSKLKLSSGLFNQVGDIVNKASYDKSIREYEESISKIIDNNLHVDGMAVRVETSEGTPAEKTINIHVFSGDINNADNLLGTLTTNYNGQISQAEFTSFLKDLILDKDGNTRAGLNDSRYERVKWQVNYEDANTANDRSKPVTDPARKAAIDNLNDLYDDGIFEMQVTKLAYPSRSVTVSINPTMKSRLYPERKAEPETPEANATGNKTNFEAETGTGKVDGDTGMHTETPTRESIIKSAPRIIMDTIKKMIADSKERKLTDNNRHYSIGGQLWSRVTSIKYALDKMGERFNPNSPWAVPSSLIGNSIDEFGRDVFNGVFDNMTEAERTAAFGEYDNSTEKNYAEAYTAFKAFEARLAGLGQAIIATGNKEDAGSITAKGTLDVTIKGDKGLETKKVRVAGTLDVLAVDSQGNLHIYDFKTKHNNILTEEEAISPNKGYDRQLSMYAKFLEDEYGLKVKSINIIPIKVEYTDPKTQADYKEARPGSNQLLKRNTKGEYEEFNGANFEVGKEFPLTRLSDAELVASFDKMSEAEKEAIVEAIQDQSDAPATNTDIKADDITTAKPDIVEEEVEEEEGGFSRKGRRFGLGRNKTTQEAPTEETIQEISPEDSNSLLNRLKELENACGGKKR